MKRQKLRPKSGSSYVFCSLVAIILAHSPLAYGADIRLAKIRVGTAADKFQHTTQLAAAFDVTSPAFLRAHHIEIAVGSISTPDDNEMFVSIGPVWRLPAWSQHGFIDFGFSPTLLSGSTFDGRNVGGNFHFTTSLSIGTKLGRRRSAELALRIQHTSNGGLNKTNPGLDFVGLEFSFGRSQ